MLAVYITGKLILLRIDTSSKNRLYAFSGTFRKPGSGGFPAENESRGRFSFKKNSRAPKDQSASSGLFGKIMNVINNTEHFQTTGHESIEREIASFISLEDDRFRNSEGLYINRGTHYQSEKLRTFLYGLALGDALLTKGKTLHTLGKDLLDKGGKFREKEKIYVE
jgi:hypothetical protein